MNDIEKQRAAFEKAHRGMALSVDPGCPEAYLNVAIQDRWEGWLLAVNHERRSREDHINDDRDALRAEIVALKGTIADLERNQEDQDRPYVDEDGNTWTRPTAWAYSMLCKAYDRVCKEQRPIRDMLNTARIYLYGYTDEGPIGQGWKSAKLQAFVDRISEVTSGAATASDDDDKITANVGRWLSAALSDPTTCQEMKDDILAWMEAGRPNVQPTASAELTALEAIMESIDPATWPGLSAWHRCALGRFAKPSSWEPTASAEPAPLPLGVIVCDKRSPNALETFIPRRQFREIEWPDADYSKVAVYAAPVVAQPIVTDEMVTRFLGWKLPRDFYPDAGISFNPPKNPLWWPVGTNLLTDPQARAMLEYVLQGAPVAAQPAPTAQEPTCLLEAIGGLIGYEPDCAEGAAGMVPGGEYVTKSEVLRVIRSCAALTPAARDVLAERRRQVEVEGYTPEKDDEYADGMLANAATAYSTSAVMTMRGHTSFGAPPTPWPWLFKHWKPTTPRRDLVKAAALILAEIERLDRAANKENQS